ncbi:MAG: hypothetical protein WA131_02615 [Desulfitobacteriaceae bacterium]
MTIIPQLNLFAWSEIEELGDFERYGYHFRKIEESLRQLIERVTSWKKNTTTEPVWNGLTVVSTCHLALNYIQFGHGQNESTMLVSLVRYVSYGSRTSERKTG